MKNLHEYSQKATCEKFLFLCGCVIASGLALRSSDKSLQQGESLCISPRTTEQWPMFVRLQQGELQVLSRLKYSDWICFLCTQCVFVNLTYKGPITPCLDFACSSEVISKDLTVETLAHPLIAGSLLCYFLSTQ